MNVFEKSADAIEIADYLLYLRIGAADFAGELHQASTLGIAQRYVFLRRGPHGDVAGINSMGISLTGLYSNDILTPRHDLAGNHLQEVSPESGQRLRDLFTRYGAITLLFDGNQCDAELAAIIAKEAKRAGRHIVAIQTGGEALAVDSHAWKTLNRFADLAVHMSSDESPAMLADMIWSSAVLPGDVGVDFSDFVAQTREQGWCHAAVLPLEEAALRNYGQSLGGFASARKFIWVNIHAQSPASYDLLSIYGNCILSLAPDDAYSMIVGMPRLTNMAATIPESLVVFHA